MTLTTLPLEVCTQICAPGTKIPMLLPTRPSYCKYNTGFVSKEAGKILKTAHAITEQCYRLFNLSLVSKDFYAYLTPERTRLLLTVVQDVSKVHAEPRGSKCLRECVDSGFFLHVLRIYFFYKPETLWNYATDESSNEGFRKTILHSAVAPNCWDISVSFATFVIKMDKTHRLNLTAHKDADGRTPLEAGRNTFSPKNSIIYEPHHLEKWQIIEPLLTQPSIEHGCPSTQSNHQAFTS